MPHRRTGSAEASPSSRLGVVRYEVKLPRDAWVVRGGLLRTSDLERACETAMLNFERPGISVYAADVGSRAALIQAVGTRVPHSELSFSKLGRLLDAGFEVEQTFTSPHHTVWLPSEPTMLEGAIQTFKSVFDAPVSRERVLAEASGG